MYIANILVTPPAVEPVNLIDAKMSARIDHDSEDQLISSQLLAARQYVERITGLALITQTRKAYYDAWPLGNAIVIPTPPLVSVTSVKYTDTAAVQTTWAATNYTVDTSSHPGRVVRKYSVEWPSASLALDRPIEVVYVCGYGLAVDVPAELRTAINLALGHWYKHREAVLSGISGTSDSKYVELGLPALVANFTCEPVNSILY